jgi:hypothetical protein
MESENYCLPKGVLGEIALPVIFKIVLLFCCIVLLSCKQENKDAKENVDFNVRLEISGLQYYPNDSISMSFRIKSSNGIAPYTCKWINPDTLIGEGPFTICLTGNLLLDVEVLDAGLNKMEFHYEILKDTIDFRKNDYRNVLTGFYKCEVVYHWATEDSPGNFITHDSIYHDTIEISKHSDVKMLKISDFPDVNYNFINSSFDGYHLSGYFKNDSIIFYYFATPVALYNWTYKGGKIN